MSTRANIVIKSPAQSGLSFYYERRSDGYPSEVVPILAAYDGTPESLSDLHLMPGQVGNFSYSYELDVGNGTIKVWDSQYYWQNAPEDWEEKGWQGCYQNKKGKWGYKGYRKGKRLYLNEYGTKVTYDRKMRRNPNSHKKVHHGGIELIPNNQYTKQQLKTLDNEDVVYQYWLKKLKFDPTLIHTWLKAFPDHYDEMYVKQIEDMPMMINSRYDFEKGVAAWRLSVNA
jgi:hypothetical protein